MNVYSGDQEIIYKLLLKTELQGSENTAYVISNAESGNSGWTFGVPQWDMGATANPNTGATYGQARSLFKNILENAKDGDGNSYLTQSEISTIMTIVANSGSLSQSQQDKINLALSSDYGKSAILVAEKEYIALVQAKVNSVLPEDISSNRDLLYALVADYHNQFDIEYKGKAYEYLDGKKVVNPIAVVEVEGSFGVADWLRFRLTQDWANQTSGVNDIWRRLSLVVSIFPYSPDDEDALEMIRLWRDYKPTHGSDASIAGIEAAFITVSRNYLLSEYGDGYDISQDDIVVGDDSNDNKQVSEDDFIATDTGRVSSSDRGDLIFALAGNDIVDAGGGNDVVYGGDGNDTINGSEGSDHIYGDEGDDYLFGGNDADTLYGWRGDDHLYGDNGNDVLYGEVGNDFLYGGEGADTLNGGLGSNYLYGGQGLDTYQATVSDYIYDSDKLGVVELNGKVLHGGSRSEDDPENTYYGDGDVYELIGTTLIVNGGLVINNFASGDLGISLTFNDDAEEEEEEEEQFESQIFGDRVLKDFDDSVDGIQPEKDEWGNYVTTDALDEGLNDNLRDTDENDEILAFAGDDYILAKNGGDDRIEGGDGDDWISDYYGDDTILGGKGSDRIGANSGDDYIYGGDAEEVSTTGDPSSRGDWISGGAGNDHIFGTAQYDVLLGGTGEDTIFGGGGDDVLIGDGYSVLTNTDWSYSGATSTSVSEGQVYVAQLISSAYGVESDGGNDRIYGGDGNDFINGNGGDDYLDGSDGNDTVFGGLGNDTLIGSSGNDLLLGDSADYTDGTGLDSRYHGNDLIDGGEGDDTLEGGAGTDTLIGGVGNDKLYGDGAIFGESGEAYKYHGNDLLYGGDGDDTIEAGGGVDTLFGGSGNDVLHGDESDLPDEYQGNDFISGEEGDDLIFGYGGNDSIYGDEGNDSVDGGAGNDTIYGGDGNDLIIGQDGNDFIFGENGDDTISGGAGSDTISGGSGNDYMAGGAGADVYYASAGQDIIDDLSNNNVINFSGVSISSASISENGTDLVVLYDDGGATVIFNIYSGTFNSFIVAGVAYSLADFLKAYMTDAVVLNAYDGEVEVIGGSGADTIYGSSSGDVLSGGDGDDVLIGGMGSDILYGGDGDDVINGGDGSDLLYGGDGNDSYLVSGGENIVDSVGLSTIIFESTVSPSSIAVNYVKSTESEYLLVFVGAEQILISGNIDNYIFVDSAGIQQSAAEFIETYSLGGITPIASEQGGALFGSKYSDIINGGVGDDQIYAGMGDDSLLLGGGNDVVFYDLGDGSDTVNSTGSSFTVKLGEGIDANNTSFVHTASGDLSVTINGLENAIVISNWYSKTDSEVDLFEFSNGTTIGYEFLSEIEVSPLYGTDSSDLIIGTTASEKIYALGGDDTVLGGGGDDVIYGGDGVDTYSIPLNADQVYIVEANGQSSFLNLAGVTLSRLESSRVGDDLILKLDSASGSLTILGYYQTTGSWSVIDSAGRTITLEELLQNNLESQQYLSAEQLVLNKYKSLIESSNLATYSQLGMSYVEGVGWIKYPSIDVVTYSYDYSALVYGSGRTPSDFTSIGVSVSGSIYYGASSSTVYAEEGGWLYAGWQDYNTVDLSYATYTAEVQWSPSEETSTTQMVTQKSSGYLYSSAQLAELVVKYSSSNSGSATVTTIENPWVTKIIAAYQLTETVTSTSGSITSLTSGNSPTATSYADLLSGITSSSVILQLNAQVVGDTVIDVYGSSASDVITAPYQAEYSDDYDYNVELNISTGAGDDLILLRNDVSYSKYIQELYIYSIIDGGLNGPALGDYVSAGDGDDTIYGSYGNDVLIGGAGSDVISGGLGSDSYYIFNTSQGGVDLIYDGGAYKVWTAEGEMLINPVDVIVEKDTIHFDEGVSVSSIVVSWGAVVLDGETFDTLDILWAENSTVRVVVANTVLVDYSSYNINQYMGEIEYAEYYEIPADSYGWGIEEIAFADGTVISLADLKSMAINDPVQPFIPSEISIENPLILSIALQDGLSISADYFTAAGTLDPSSLSYVFTLNGNGGSATLSSTIVEGVVVVDNLQEQLNFLLNQGFISSIDSLSLTAMALDSAGNSVSSVVELTIDTSAVGTGDFTLVDGTDSDDVLYAPVTGGYLWGEAGDDLIVGSAFYDELYGDAGNDTIMGGSGGDWYGYYSGSGNDVIIETAEDPHVVVSGFTTAINYEYGSSTWTSSEGYEYDDNDYLSLDDISDFYFSYSGDDLLLTNMNAANESITIQGWGSGQQIEVFTSGTGTLYSNQIDLLVSQMASFEVPDGGVTYFTDDQKQQLEAITSSLAAA